MMTTYTKADLALVTNMNKQRLREACKAAGITSYGKLDNAGMRRALQNHIEANMAQVPETKPEDMPVQQSASAEPVVTTPPAAEAPAAPAPAEKPKAAPAPKDQRNGITRPGPGKCRDVWNACDAILAANQKVTLAGIKEKVPEINDSTARTQMQRHKTFHAEPSK